MWPEVLPGLAAHPARTAPSGSCAAQEVEFWVARWYGREIDEELYQACNVRASRCPRHARPGRLGAAFADAAKLMLRSFLALGGSATQPDASNARRWRVGSASLQRHSCSHWRCSAASTCSRAPAAPSSWRRTALRRWAPPACTGSPAEQVRRPSASLPGGSPNVTLPWPSLVRPREPVQRGPWLVFRAQHSIFCVQGRPGVRCGQLYGAGRDWTAKGACWRPHRIAAPKAREAWRGEGREAWKS